MKKRKNLSFILIAFLFAIVLHTDVIHAADQTMILQPGESYEFTDTSPKELLRISINNGVEENNGETDYFIYRPNGQISGFGRFANMSLSLSVAGGGARMIVSAKSGVNGVKVSFSDSTTFKKATPPPVANVTLQPGESTEVTNTDLREWKDVSVDLGMDENLGSFNYVTRFGDGYVFQKSSQSYISPWRSHHLKIPPGGHISITAQSGIEGIEVSYVSDIDTPIEIPATSITLNQENISLEVGAQAKLRASVVPSNANATLRWTSDNEAVATVDEAGNVVAVAEGTANITVSTVDGSLTAKAVVTVIPAIENPPIDEEITDGYKKWPSKFNVAVDHTFSVNFSMPFDSETILTHNLYITDSENKTVPISFIIENKDQNPSTVLLKPLYNYTRGETYTLWIKDVLGKNGEVLKQNVKMDFTINNKSSYRRLATPF